ncbi:RNA polymerase sigma factor [Olivibacter sp. XZL3]|uniref:RNA polymerase sigma factor n=1 Tax=Olivibacter sp. XZL3 TaxID=1735116 RepID=UPI00106590AB|nr:sigma-70 family RNA polymerase sigma factor [Olivibacter sp. XZL3]
MKVATEKSDKALLEALKNHQTAAFEELFNRYWKSLYVKAYARLRDETFAQDMVQDVFADIWDRRALLVVEGSLYAYLSGALKYRIINWLARTNLHQEALKHLVDRMGEMEATILDTLTANDIKITLEEAVAQFPENMQRIFALRSENYTIREIAEALGLAEQTVKNNSTEALVRLKKVLAEKHPDVHQSFFAVLLLLMKN